MPMIGLIFELRRAETKPGEIVRVSGGAASLGRWAHREDSVLELRTSTNVYPLWTMLTPVWIEAPDDKSAPMLEYKYVKDPGPWAEVGQNILWEDRIRNRRVAVPQEGVWVVSDARWDTSGTPQLRRAPMQGIGRPLTFWDVCGLKALQTRPLLELGAGTRRLEVRLTPTATPLCSARSGAPHYDIEAGFEALGTAAVKRGVSLPLPYEAKETPREDEESESTEAEAHDGHDFDEEDDWRRPSSARGSGSGSPQLPTVLSLLTPRKLVSIRERRDVEAPEVAGKELSSPEPEELSDSDVEPSVCAELLELRRENAELRRLVAVLSSSSAKQGCIPKLKLGAALTSKSSLDASKLAMGSEEIDHLFPTEIILPQSSARRQISARSGEGGGL